jgi:hypothetical protein
MRNNLGINSDNLLLGAQSVILLEFEISDSPGQCQITIDSAKLDESTSTLYSRSLLWMVSLLAILYYESGLALVGGLVVI